MTQPPDSAAVSLTSPGPAHLRRALGLRSVVSTSTGLAFAALEYLTAAGLVAYVAGDAAWIAIGSATTLVAVAVAAWAKWFPDLRNVDRLAVMTDKNS